MTVSGTILCFFLCLERDKRTCYEPCKLPHLFPYISPCFRFSFPFSLVRQSLIIPFFRVEPKDSS